MSSSEVDNTKQGKFNNATNRDTSEGFDSFYFYEVEQFTVLWLLFILIVIGNCGVLVTLIFSRSRKNSRMNFFITHLALADLLVGVINVLTDIIWRMTVSWNAGNVTCKIVKYLQVLVTYASTYVLVALSIDRYDAIRHPMKFTTSFMFVGRRAKGLIFSAWTLSILFSVPILVFYEEKTVQDQLQCWIEFSAQWQWKVYMTLVAVSLFIIPAIVITICYTVIIITIRSKSFISVSKCTNKNDHKTLSSTGSDSSKRVSSRGLIPRAKVKTVKVTLVIVSVFILCWSPYIIFDLLQVYDHIPKTQTNIAIATFVQSLAPLNSAANPIIYCIFSTNLLKTIWGFPCFKWMCPKRSGDSASQNNTRSSSLSEFITQNTQQNKRRRVSNAQTNATML